MRTRVTIKYVSVSIQNKLTGTVTYDTWEDGELFGSPPSGNCTFGFTYEPGVFSTFAIDGKPYKDIPSAFDKVRNSIMSYHDGITRQTESYLWDGMGTH